MFVSVLGDDDHSLTKIDIGGASIYVPTIDQKLPVIEYLDLYGLGHVVAARVCHEIVQRIRSVDNLSREEIVLADPDDAIAKLQAYNQGQFEAYDASRKLDSGS